MLEIDQIKIKLYSLLLRKTDLTDNEIDLMNSLSKDPAIQSVLDKS